MGVCLSDELVEHYLTGSCSDDERQAIETHLSHCEDCRQRIESAKSTMADSRQSDTATDATAKQGRTIRPAHPTVSMAETSSPPTETHIPDTGLESMLEGYEILEELPRGAQAVVYKATQKATKRTVAVKVLSQGPHASPRARYRFEREVELAASLRHPNIVTIHDSGIARGQYFFAMEYIQGKPLDQYAQAEKLSVRETMEIFNKVCSAVMYAHQLGVMHRDLKPGNILVDTKGEPHILDFGLAKFVSSSEQTTEETVMTSIPGKVIGTLAFMSPEQASAQPGAIDVRTDVYSLGMILYRVLTGDFPYAVDGSMLEILRNIQETEPTRPSKIMRNLNSDVEAILLKALTKEPVHRYQSAAELQHDIDYWLKGLPISARADSSIYMFRKLLARHRYTSTVVALLLVIVLSFSYVSFDLYLTAKKAQRNAKAAAAEATTKFSIDENLSVQQITFDRFLQVWDAENLTQTKWFEKYFRFVPEYEREHKAVLFWIDKKPLAEKVAEFRQELGKSEPCFTEFVIAEYHLRYGERNEAIQAYRKCLSHGADLPKDQWLTIRAKSRLYDLTEQNQPDKASPAVRD
ncbi:MAG: protein kinase [Planctomycetota bacterium]|nr:MAG: protein kinase [Planctomycetota bacterium]